MVGSAKFLTRKQFLFGATPAINNDPGPSSMGKLFLGCQIEQVVSLENYLPH
jgi:hypothetical protein